MAATYTLISTTELTGTAASVSFSSIPNTYKDLVIRASARITDATRYGSLDITYNDDTSNYGYYYVYYNKQSAIGGATGSSTASAVRWLFSTGGATVTNLYASNEFYIGGYKDTDKQKSAQYTSGVRSTASAENWYIGCGGGNWQNTSAITKITITPNSGNLATGCIFSLYGIKDS